MIEMQACKNRGIRGRFTMQREFALAELETLVRKYRFQLSEAEEAELPDIKGNKDSCLVFVPACVSETDAQGRQRKRLRVTVHTNRLAEETPASLRAMADELLRAAAFVEEIEVKKLTLGEATVETKLENEAD